MLPCQETCADYRCGCHKTCARWAEMKEAQRCRREAKKEYLRYYNRSCADMLRQFLRLQARYPAR